MPTSPIAEAVVAPLVELVRSESVIDQEVAAASLRGLAADTPNQVEITVRGKKYTVPLDGLLNVRGPDGLQWMTIRRKKGETLDGLQQRCEKLLADAEVRFTTVSAAYRPLTYHLCCARRRLLPDRARSRRWRA